MTHTRLGRLSTTIIKVGHNASPESLVEISNQIMQLGSLYYVHFEQDDLKEIVKELYSRYRFAPISGFVECW